MLAPHNTDHLFNLCTYYIVCVRIYIYIYIYIYMCVCVCKITALITFCVGTDF